MESFTKRLLIVALPLAAAFCAGCPQAGPGQEAVLSGAWTVTLDADENGEQTILEFDAFGNIVRFGTINGNTTVSTTNVSGTSTVSGANVSIKVDSNDFKFEGEFNTDFTVAHGKKFAEFDFLGTTTTIDQSAATMVKSN